MTHSQSPASKLFIRSEVLSVVEFLTTCEDAPKHDKAKQIKRLNQIEDKATVIQVLIKELQRTTTITTLQTIGELLMEFAEIEQVKEPLWKIIESTDLADEVKDVAHLVLRQLGDESDPSLYLDYLEDPEGLINRETERMLEVAAKNPEALIDFIDFIFSLPVDEQCNLVRSLQVDYEPESLVNIYLPTLDALPPFELAELILASLGQTKSKRATWYIQQLEQRNSTFVEHPRFKKAIQRSLNELRLSGAYKPDSPIDPTSLPPHPIVSESELFECYATLPDGIGNQGIIVSRKKQNGDIAMMCVAINDIHGVMDCFGFYELSESDFHKLVRKFHEECSKIMVPAIYCLQLLKRHELLNDKDQFRIPYEYSCWKVMLDDVAPTQQALDLNTFCKDIATPDWESHGANLYHHPDFSTWFLEEGDHPVVTIILGQVINILGEQAASEEISPANFQLQMEVLSETLIHGLLAGEWRDILKQRLQQAAYLLKQQDANTFASLAASEVVHLEELDLENTLAIKSGFMLYYGRRCVEEALLRIKTELPQPNELNRYIEHVLKNWQV